MLSIFDKLYLNRFSDAERKAKKVIWEVLCRDFFQQFISPEDTVLDLGAGSCEFINFIRANKKIAIDELTIAEFAEKDVEVLDKIENIEHNSVDVIFMSNFLEHLLSFEDVLSNLTRVKEVLKNKGKLILIGPNMSFAYKNYWIFIDHRIPLTDLSVAELLRALDFKLIKVIKKFLPYTTKSKYPKWKWLVKVYLKVPILWNIFGKQYLILCEKETQ